VKGAVKRAAALLFFLAAASANAEEDLWKDATQALAQGKASESIAAFEALADRGVRDPHVSFDRGLAYATRVKIGAEQPGDLGRAAHGFEEARALSASPEVDAQAGRALTLLRAEVARRKARAGEPVDMEQHLSLGRTMVELVREDTWAILALCASALLGVGLFMRLLSENRRVRVGGAVVASIAGVALGVTAGLTYAARDARLHLREGVVVSATARPSDEKGLALPGASPLPEAARVRVLESRAGLVRVRWGSVEGWVVSSAVRPIAALE
jgi:hypothetical protein